MYGSHRSIAGGMHNALFKAHELEFFVVAGLHEVLFVPQWIDMVGETNPVNGACAMQIVP